MNNRIFVTLAVIFALSTTTVVAQYYGTSGSKTPAATTTTTAAATTTKAGDITQIMAGNPDLASFQDALTMAGVLDMLKEAGPFTVFAPINTAFSKLTPEAQTNFKDPKKSKKQAPILKYHVVQGEFDGPTIVSAIKLGGGSANIMTLSGKTLTGMFMNDTVVLKDGKGNTVAVINPNVPAANGIIHIIDTVLTP